TTTSGYARGLFPIATESAPPSPGSDRIQPAAADTRSSPPCPRAERAANGEREPIPYPLPPTTNRTRKPPATADFHLNRKTFLHPLHRHADQREGFIRHPNDYGRKLISCRRHSSARDCLSARSC